MNTTNESCAFLAKCQDACVLLESGISENSVRQVEEAFEAIFYAAVEHRGARVPLLELIPEVPPVLEAAAVYADKISARKQAAARHAEWVASLPSASDLMKEVDAAGESYNFVGYQLWRESGGWALTNAYGVDNCMFLASEFDFQRLIALVKSGAEIGPVPHGSEPDDDDFPSYDDTAACHVAAESLLIRLGLASKSEAGALVEPTPQ